MSAFGDKNFKAEALESLEWITGTEDPEDLLAYLHKTILETAETGTKHLHIHLFALSLNYGLTQAEICSGLAEVYHYIVTQRLRIEEG